MDYFFLGIYSSLPCLFLQGGLRVPSQNEAFGFSTLQHDQIHFSSSYLHTHSLKAETHWMPFSLLSEDYLSGSSWLAEVDIVQFFLWMGCVQMWVCVRGRSSTRWHSRFTSSDEYLGAPLVTMNRTYRSKSYPGKSARQQRSPETCGLYNWFIAITFSPLVIVHHSNKAKTTQPPLSVVCSHEWGLRLLLSSIFCEEKPKCCSAPAPLLHVAVAELHLLYFGTETRVSHTRHHVGRTKALNKGRFHFLHKEKMWRLQQQASFLWHFITRAKALNTAPSIPRLPLNTHDNKW